MPTEKERIALAKAKRAKDKAEVKKIQAKILAKQLAQKKASKAKGKEKLSNIKNSIQNTSAKQSRDKADREIAYNKSVAKVKDINKKAGRTLKNDPETNAQTLRSQNTRLGIPNDFSPKNKDTANRGANLETDKPKTTEKSTVTPARIKKINKEKQSVTNMQNKINATDQANFEAARKKLRGSSSSMDEMSKAVAEANIDLTGKSKDIDPETNVSNTKKERRQLLRARRRAGRKSSDGTYTSDQLKAERDKIVKRGAARKQYLRNFASQLARGEQAAPIRGFGEGDGNPANDATLAGASKEVAAKNAETDSFAKNILGNFASIGNDNSDLLSNNIQSLGSFESEDSSPSTFMKLEYRKKRGGY